MNKLSVSKRACILFVFCAATGIALRAHQAARMAEPAVIFKTLHEFNGTDGANPDGALVQGADGNLYGTTYNGGASNRGTLFKMNTSDSKMVWHSFDGRDGASPLGALIQATDGSFYGVTWMGGGHGAGTVFKVPPPGKLRTIYSFCSRSSCADGSLPDALVQGIDGNFYGTTRDGGFGNNPNGGVFKISPSGEHFVLHTFDGPDGSQPEGGLIQGTDGNFYGTTQVGGATFFGTVFKITTSGALTTLHSFCSPAPCADGELPEAGLVEGTDGNFYGTATRGGADDSGTVFMITPSGALTTLHSFGGPDGYGPEASLVQASDGNFYGTTVFGGADDEGTIFKITASGELTTLYSFKGGNLYSIAALIQDTNGDFYGTTLDGGNTSCKFGCGAIFTLSVGLGPFVETNPGAATVGAAVKILGSNLTGATSVTFNGTAATFTVKSSSEITTTVPAGATTGTVQVYGTSSGTLSSNLPFRVE